MKLDNYTASKMQEQIAKFLFIKWIKGGLKDSKDSDVQELYELYHEIMARQVSVIDE
jgi:hypothetical protein